MRKRSQMPGIFLVLLTAACLAAGPRTALAASAAEIDKNVDVALEDLYASTPAAQELAKVATGILVFPRVVKAGLIVGGHTASGRCG